MPAAQPFSLWLDTIPRPGWLNMAIDSALLERAEAGERWLRLYAWDPPCLSFGRHEPAARRYDAARIEALGLAVVRRPTGGRAVWHARELTYAVAAPCEGLGTLREAYDAIHRVLRDALRLLGAPAELAPSRTTTPIDAGACFAVAAGGEVLIGGRKVVGSAQLRRGKALLQHGSVLLEDDQATVLRVSLGTTASDGSAPLSRVLGRAVGWDDAARSVAEAAGRRWAMSDVVAPDAVVERALALADRFRSPEWTWAGGRGR
ncbi:MAG: hypothetical protein ABIQ49_00360 [Gemmatimonadales bacterium]